MALYGLTVNNVEAPVGVDGAVRFGWKMQSDRQGWKQISYRITVASGNSVLWDSGEVFSDASVAIAYGGQLRSFTQYEWSVTLRDDKDRCHTANSFFETGLLQKSDLEGGSFVAGAWLGATYAL